MLKHLLQVTKRNEKSAIKCRDGEKKKLESLGEWKMTVFSTMILMCETEDYIRGNFLFDFFIIFVVSVLFFLKKRCTQTPLKVLFLRY